MTFDCCRHCGDMACPGGRDDHEVPCPVCQKKEAFGVEVKGGERQ